MDKKNNLKVCVTGGAGMIGSNLVKELVKKKYKVTVIDNLWRGKLSNLLHEDKYLIDIENNFYKLDLSDSRFNTQISNVFAENDIVIHLADIVAGIGYVFNKQYEIFRINNFINSNVFNSCKNSGISKLIYVGTACSFPLELQNSIDSELNDIDLFPANPESAYGWSKLIGQLELKYLKDEVQFEINTLMLHNVYGPNCEFEGERTQVIPSLINKIINAKDGDIINVWGSGEQGRAFIHVDDIVSGIIKTIENNNLPDFMQLGPSKCTTIKELVNELVDISGKKLKISFDKSKPEGDKGRYANNSKAVEFLNWNISKDLKIGLKETYKWIEQQ
jgi:nucleoside-diphosphate-sugar epimerase